MLHRDRVLFFNFEPNFNAIFNEDTRRRRRPLNECQGRQSRRPRAKSRFQRRKGRGRDFTRKTEKGVRPGPSMDA